MGSILLNTKYILVLDTNSYSEHFAEHLCAYCTGIYGENHNPQVVQAGDLYFEEEEIGEENPFNPFIDLKMNEDGHYSPCCVMLNRKYGCNADGQFAVLTKENEADYNFPAPLSVGIFFYDYPSIELIDVVRRRAKSFFDVYNTSTDSNVVFEGMRFITIREYAEEEAL
jgi:hypothetical protein